MSWKVRAILTLAILITAVSARAEIVGDWNRDHSRVLQAVQSLTGSIYGDYTHGSMSLAEAFGETLGIPDGGYAPLGDLALYSGCRQHSCDEKAAVLLDQHARVRAAGLIHFNCTNARAQTCLTSSAL